jgi:hypothetical protein
MAAALTTLVSFDGPDGSTPEGDLIADATATFSGRPRAAALTATGWCSKSPIRETSTSRSTTARLSSMDATPAERFSLSEAGRGLRAATPSTRGDRDVTTRAMFAGYDASGHPVFGHRTGPRPERSN